MCNASDKEGKSIGKSKWSTENWCKATVFKKSDKPEFDYKKTSFHLGLLKFESRKSDGFLFTVIAIICICCYIESFSLCWVIIQFLIKC